MTGYLNQQKANTRTAEIIPFPSTDTSSSSEANIYSSLISDVLTNPSIENHLKGIIEGAVMDTWVKAHIADFGILNDPFDAIYISELRADDIHSHNIDKITQHSNIIDLSDTISFDDEWED